MAQARRAVQPGSPPPDSKKAGANTGLLTYPPAKFLDDRSSLDRADDERDNRQHKEDDEQDLCNRGGRAGDTAKAKRRCDDRENEKRQGPTKHLSAPFAHPWLLGINVSVSKRFLCVQGGTSRGRRRSPHDRHCAEGHGETI